MVVVGAGYVADQAIQQALESGELGVGDAAAKPLVEADRRRAQAKENCLPGVGQLDHMYAAVGRVAVADYQALDVHGVQMVGKCRLRDPDRRGQLPLAGQLQGLQVQQHQPDGKRSADIGKGIAERPAYLPGGPGQLKAGSRPVRSHGANGSTVRRY
jgi:hypothetical protein